MTTGKVYLVGAGPGDPELITVKGRRRLAEADVVVYDYLANPALLDTLALEVECIYVGKRHGNHHLPQDQINQLLIDKAREGAVVVRLKGGDPFIFGRGGEEATALAESGVPFEVIPGITAATAVTAYAGIPLTHRGVNASVTFVTGSEDPEREETMIRWKELGRASETLVFFMGMRSLPVITRRLIEGGRAADTPAAVIRWGTHPCQQTVTGTLENLATHVAEAGIRPPALIVVGDVVRFREQINWFESLPLFGRRILVTRAASQKGTLVRALADLGAEVVGVPTIRIVDPQDFAPLDDAIGALERMDWVVLTSKNGVEHFFRRLNALGKDSRALAGCQVAVVGRETAKALEAAGVKADLVPEHSHAEGLAEAMVARGVAGKQVLLAQAEQARAVLPETLSAGGAAVTAVTVYRTVCPEADDTTMAALTDPRGFDYVTFTSGSTVRNLNRILGNDRFHAILKGARVAAIGPVTGDAAGKAGLSVDLMPDNPDIPSLVATIREDAATRRRTDAQHARGETR